MLAFGYADGAAATELTKHKFTTDPEGDPTANTFAFDISGVTARSASIQVEPSDKSVRYIWDIVTDAEYKKYGGNAEGIRSYLADYIKGQIDDFFTTPVENPANAVDLFEILEAREGRGSTLIATQLEPDQWYLRINSDLCADSILNRVVEHARFLDIKGPNMREYTARLKAEREKGYWD